jgi:hypothetical protein
MICPQPEVEPGLIRANRCRKRLGPEGRRHPALLDLFPLRWPIETYE